MQTNFKKRIYTPQVSEASSITIRSLASALNLPMTKTIDIIIKELSLVFSPSDICPKCQYKNNCNLCAFNRQAADAAA